MTVCPGRIEEVKPLTKRSLQQPHGVTLREHVALAGDANPVGIAQRSRSERDFRDVDACPTE